jgi:hypothetical protein
MGMINDLTKLDLNPIDNYQCNMCGYTTIYLHEIKQHILQHKKITHSHKVNRHERRKYISAHKNEMVL